MTRDERTHQTVPTDELARLRRIEAAARELLNRSEGKRTATGRPLTEGRPLQMAGQPDVRRIALSLPETIEAEDRFAFSVRNGSKEKGFAWSWAERVDPKEARVPNPDVLAVRVANAGEKEMLLASDPQTFFTEPHYDGFPAVLVRLAAIDVDELRELLTDAWRCQAPRALVKTFDLNQP